MKHPKNQHTVPCLYLREFAVERGAKHPQIYAFDKTNQRVHRTSIRNVAAQMHFYEREDTGIEKSLQRFEDLFAAPYRRLLTIDKPSDLTQEEIAAVVGFSLCSRCAHVRCGRCSGRSMSTCRRC